MANWNRYRIYCETEAAWVPTQADSPPTVCPNNPGHTVTAGSAVQLDSKRVILVPDADGQGILGGDAGVGDEMERVIGAMRIDKSTALTVPALAMQCSTGHATGYACLLLDMDVDAPALDIDSEATGYPLINLQPVSGNSRGDIAFGAVRTSNPSSPSEGDFWYNTTDKALRYYDGASVKTLETTGGSEGPWSVSAGVIYPDNASTDDVVVGASAMSSGERFRVVGGARIEKSDAQNDSGLYLQVSGSHPTGATYPVLLLDVDVNVPGLDIDSEATGHPLINLQGLNGNSRGDIAFGTVRTGDPSAPSEGDLWYEATSEELKFRKSASTVEVRDAFKLQGRSVAATAPTDGQVLTWNNTGTQWEPQGAPGPYSNVAEANGDITTTSTTYVLATGMTITPPAGTYMVWFSSSLGSDTNNAQMWASIYSGGTQVSGSERELMRGAAQGNVSIGFCCVARVTVNGSQAIEGRWRVTASSTGTMENGRTLAIIKVA
jgi:hypothetical protein